MNQDDLENKVVEYSLGSEIFEGFISAKNSEEKLPVILFIHDWTGLNNFVIEKSKEYASKNYFSFAVDMYGKGKRGSQDSKELNQSLIEPLISNRNLITDRLKAAITFLKSFNNVDLTKITVIGFCFGGLCALDLARSGEDVSAVISVHGLLFPSENNKNINIRSKILALHGNDDPMVSSDDILNFKTEMTENKADWQMHVYGNAMHAFTNPLANDKDFGIMYDNLISKRTWNIIDNFIDTEVINSN